MGREAELMAACRTGDTAAIERLLSKNSGGGGLLGG